MNKLIVGQYLPVAMLVAESSGPVRVKPRYAEPVGDIIAREAASHNTLTAQVAALKDERDDWRHKARHRLEMADILEKQVMDFRDGISALLAQVADLKQELADQEVSKLRLIRELAAACAGRHE